MTEQQEREAFEAWASDQGHVIVRLWGDYSRQGVYVDLRTKGAWEAWQARAALEAEAKPAPAEPVAWGMRDKTTGLILDVICPDEHDSHAGDYTIPLYVAPCWTPEQVAKTQEIAAELKAKVKVKPEAAPAAPAPHPDTKDAERYRWLRDQWDRADVLERVMLSNSADGKTWVGGGVLDQRIDAAIAASIGKGGAA